MSRTKLTKLLVATLGGLAGASLLLVFLSYVNKGAGFSHCTISTGIGWSLPLLTGLLVWGVVWALLRKTTPAPRSPMTEVRCIACGESIRSGWRLCPHCGNVTAEKRVDAGNQV